MAVGAYAILTLAETKALLGIASSDTTNDTVLEYCIDQATALTEQVIGCVVKSRLVTEWHDANGATAVVLRTQPVESIAFVGFSRRNALTVTAGSNAISCTVSIGADGMTVSGYNGNTDTAFSDDYSFTTYPTVQSISAAGPTEYSFTLLENAESFMLVPGSYDAMSSPATIERVIADGCRFRLDTAQGVLTLASQESSWSDYDGDRMAHSGLGGPSGASRVAVRYTAGWSTVPNDIKRACFDAVRVLYMSRSTDDSKQSESLGDYSYSRGGTSAGATAQAVAALTETLASRIRLR
jgi:hypothetical protein